MTLPTFGVTVALGFLTLSSKPLATHTQQNTWWCPRRPLVRSGAREWVLFASASHHHKDAPEHLPCGLFQCL